jgi:hypothetical protein
MASQESFEGDVKIVLDNLNREIEAIEGKTIGGLLAAGLIVQRAAQIRVPVEYGFLRASAYTRKAMDNPMQVEVGFSSNYALWVHENVEVHAGDPRPSGLGVYWGPMGRPKFLTLALSENSDKIVETITKYAKV